MISCAVTAYCEGQRGNYGWIRECLAPMIASPHVDEVVVYDDGSERSDQVGLLRAISTLDTRKVTLHAGEVNQGVFAAKLEAVSRCRGEWVQECDSDNVMGLDYFEHLAGLREAWDRRTWICPERGLPELDYREMAGTWSIETIEGMVRFRHFQSAINTGNQFVNRQGFLDRFGEYLGKRWDLTLPDYFGLGDRRGEVYWRRVFDSADSWYYNKRWLEGGGRLRIQSGLQYLHRRPKSDERPSSWAMAPKEKDRVPGLFTDELIRASRASRGVA